MKHALLISLILISLTGCAHDTSEIRAEYIPSYAYDNLECDSLRVEAHRIIRQTEEVARRVNDDADTDDMQMALGAVIFWPALLFLEGEETHHTREYARLKGHMNAIEEVSIRKNCGIIFRSM